MLKLTFAHSSQANSIWQRALKTTVGLIVMAGFAVLVFFSLSVILALVALGMIAGGLWLLYARWKYGKSGLFGSLREQFNQQRQERHEHVVSTDSFTPSNKRAAVTIDGEAREIR